MSKVPLRRPSRKRGRRQKRNLEEEQGVQAVQKKTMQQGAQTPEDVTSWSAKVVRVTPRQRAKWCPLPKSTRECLESMMHWLITSLLYETTDNWSETEKDLNLLKKRLLKHFETLRVPVEKMSSLKSVHEIVAEEKKKSLVMKEGLAELQNEIDKVMSAVEFKDQNIQCLQNKVQELKCELSAASKVFQRVHSDDLALPDLSEDQLKAPILQNELLKIGNQQGLLNNLNTIQQSDEMKTMLAFLEQAYENVAF
ncbi:centromere protein Q [Elgaria multicarinata webbii]|uniref:centromere protein Q n=1 Tax=Elgaria multicarinata webbii TaxID=159646 RepID=UPI002FCD2EA2